jgi:hypothetical protein
MLRNERQHRPSGLGRPELRGDSPAFAALTHTAGISARLRLVTLLCAALREHREAVVSVAR